MKNEGEDERVWSGRAKYMGISKGAKDRCRFHEGRWMEVNIRPKICFAVHHVLPLS